MRTPIYDFVTEYLSQDVSRLHMPGHKGRPFLGCEPRDLTEIAGADNLADPSGIIQESEANASALFGTAGTFYTTGGSSQAICAMLYLASSVYPRHGRRFRILAARNVHKAFVHACALLDCDAKWLWSGEQDSLCSCRISPASLEEELQRRHSTGKEADAVYITSPDYLGNVADIRSLASVCAKYGLPLLVDNAHGAYLHFLPVPVHPMDLGASMCCDSAHKTLPVLTGGAYLHIAKPECLPAFSASQAPSVTSAFSGDITRRLLAGAHGALALFGSSSPSYLVLQSLDLCNRTLSETYPENLKNTVFKVALLKKELQDLGIPVRPTEGLKLVVSCTAPGLTGSRMAEHLRDYGVEVEFADIEFVVMMFTPENEKKDYARILKAFAALCPLPPDPQAKTGPGSSGKGQGIFLPAPEQVCSIREAVFAPSETIPVSEAAGRICAAPTVSCPPAVPIVISGERITPEAVQLMRLYGMEKVTVTREDNP